MHDMNDIDQEAEEWMKKVLRDPVLTDGEKLSMVSHFLKTGIMKELSVEHQPGEKSR
jgi:hypothetical protein